MMPFRWVMISCAPRSNISRRQKPSASLHAISCLSSCSDSENSNWLRLIDPDTWRKGEFPSVVVLYAFDHALTLLPLLKKQSKSPNEMKTINDLGSWVSEQFAGTPEIHQDARTGRVFD